MDITRPAYWNIAGHQWMFVVFAVTVAVFGWGCVRGWQRWKTAARPTWPPDPWARLRFLATEALAQRRLLRERSAGLAHLALSWGFVLLFIGTLVSALDTDFGLPVMRGSFYLWFQSLTLDVAGIAASLALVLFLWRRYLTRAPRLRQPSDRSRPVLDALLATGLLVVLVTGFVMEGIRISVTGDPWGNWSPAGQALARLLQPVSEEVQRGVHASFWWLHLILGCALVAAVPFTKLAHLVVAPVNLFFTPAHPRDLTLPPVDFEKEGTLGLAEGAQLDGKKALELESCTECGRCQANCPAYAAGQPLSPKALVMDIRDHMRGLPARPPVHLNPQDPRPLADGVPRLIAAATPEAIWSCVTCGACVEACPVGVDHVPTIVEMRRHLVMELATAPERLQTALGNLDARGTPFVGVGTSRTAWIGDLPVPRMSDRKQVQLLYWVGCAASFDERAQKVARATATLLTRAGVDYGVLGEEESCTGDAARRIGDEVLFTMSAERVVDTLSRYQFDAIVTTCAHCYHSLKNEYPALGGRYQVRHHTDVFQELLRQGRLVPRTAMQTLATYHDPCYLGRYNGGYDAPRGILDAIPGLGTVEMPRNRESSFCCGAGGGQTFTTEVAGGRISHARADQVLATGASTVATACPFCAPMLQDGLAVRTPQGSGTPKVLDVAEILDVSTREGDD